MEESPPLRELLEGEIKVGNFLRLITFFWFLSWNPALPGNLQFFLRDFRRVVLYIYMKRGKDCSFAFFFVVKWGNRVEDDSR